MIPSPLTYRYYRQQIRHSMFTSFMLASDLAGLRRVMFWFWVMVCIWIGWHLPTRGCP